MKDMYLVVALAGVLLMLWAPLADAAVKRPTRRARPPRDKQTAQAPIKDAQPLPRALIIGDSISMGYTPPTKKLLAGKVDLHRIPVNGGPTSRGLQELDNWLGRGNWDIIHFNWGLHDMKHVKQGKLDLAGRQQVAPKQYEQNLRQLVKRLNATGAKLIWASTTPVPAGAGGRRPEDAPLYNAIAGKIMKVNDVAVNDLYAFALPRLGRIQQPRNVHFLRAGSQALAVRVAAAILEAVGAPAASTQPVAASAPEAGGACSRVYKHAKQGKLQMHFHFPPNWKPTDKRPAVVFFFGGGWNGGSVRQFSKQAEYFAQRGMVAARADYRVRSRHKVAPDSCVEDAKSAVRYLRANAVKLGIDTDRIVAAGGSAGGHIAACTAATKGLEAPGEDTEVSSRPNALILFNPVLDLTVPPMASRLGGREQLARQISPVANLTADTPPALLMYGTRDKFCVQGKAYVEAAGKAGCRAEMFVAEGQSHGFFNRSPWLARTLIRADEFLATLGYVKGKPTIKPPSDSPSP